MFDSLSDSDVYFYPSKASLVPEKDFKLHQSIAERIRARSDGCRVGRTSGYAGYDEHRAFAQLDDEMLRQMSKERVRKQLAGHAAPESHRQIMEKLDFECLKEAQKIAKELSEGDK